MILNGVNSLVNYCSILLTSLELFVFSSISTKIIAVQIITCKKTNDTKHMFSDGKGLGDSEFKISFKRSKINRMLMYQIKYMLKPNCK